MISTTQRILGSKQRELRSLVQSRKRKLHELYNVAAATEHQSEASLSNALVEFFDLNDIEKGRRFDERTLPPRPYDAAPTPTPANALTSITDTISQRHQKHDANTAISSSKGLQPSLFDRTKADRATSPESRSKGEVSSGQRSNGLSPVHVHVDNSTNTSSQLSQVDHNERLHSKDLAAQLHGVPSPDDEKLPKDDWERRRIQTKLESPLGSPGINPASIRSQSTQTAVGQYAQSSSTEQNGEHEQFARRQRSDVNERSPTATLDQFSQPSTSQRNQSDTLQILSPSTLSNLPTPISTAGANVQSTRNHDGTSPSSTIGPYSAHTPGIGASSDTSPENEVQPGDNDRFQQHQKLSPIKESRPASRVDGSSPKRPANAPQSTTDQQLSAVDQQLQLEHERAQTPTAASAIKDTYGTTASNLQSGGDAESGQDGTAPSKSAIRSDRRSSFVFPGVPDAASPDDSKHSRRISDMSGLESDLQLADMDSSLMDLDSTQDLSHTGLTDHDTSYATNKSTTTEKRKALPPLPIKDIQQNARPSDEFAVGDSMVLEDSALVATPTKATPVSATVRSPPERMTTRVSSGAIRHKSVSEILGGPIIEQRPATASSDKLAEKVSAEPPKDQPQQPQQSATDLATTTEFEISPMSRLLHGERRDKERVKRSTVVFGSKQHDGGALTPSTVVKKPHDTDDYLLTLFAAQASSPPRSILLNNLIATARKTVTTADHYVDFHEQQDCRILKKIYQLQSGQRWSLRQIERSAEPPRKPTHWDHLLGDVKWLQTDFREERKWKLVMAKNLADLCAEYAQEDDEGRQAMRVKIKKQQSTVAPPADASMSDQPEPTPDLIASAEDDSVSESLDDDHMLDMASLTAPAAIFSLPPTEILFGMAKTAASDKLLQELPLYKPPSVPDSSFAASMSSLPKPSAILPVSKYVLGKIVTDVTVPPRKKSRYDYELEGDRDEFSIPYMQPEQDDVALFSPEGRPILERIHTGHAFRPPSEFGMPMQSFYESRSSSQWTAAEDDELRALVKEYAMNWSLISSMLTPSTLYTSTAERRTPWECFERWVGFEGIPVEMQKTSYFRTYSSRVSNAQRIVMDQQSQQMQQQNGMANTPLRRPRTIQPLRVERRKNTKYLAIIDAMRKLAKKRESSLHKQKQAASLQAIRKAAAEMPTSTRGPMKSPREFSRLKYEREKVMLERQEVYRQQIYASQQNAIQQARANAQPNSARLNAAPRPPSGAAAVAAMNGSSPVAGHAVPSSQMAALAAQSRSNVPVQNGAIAYPVTSSAAMPNVNGQFSMPYKNGMQVNGAQGMMGAQRYPMANASDVRLMTENAARIQQGQRQIQQNQAQAAASTSPNRSGFATNQASVNQNNALMAALQSLPNANGMTSPFNSPYNQMPRTSQSQMVGSSQPQQLSSGLIPQVVSYQHQLKARNPGMSDQDIQRMSAEHLRNRHMQMSQSAINAAAGGQGMGMAAANMMGAGANNTAMMNGTNTNGTANSNTNNLLAANRQQQLYNQSLRAQQASQSMGNGGNGSNGAGGAGGNMSNGMGGRPPSRSATPQTQRPGSAQAVANMQGQSQSPRPPQAQLAGGQ